MKKLILIAAVFVSAHSFGQSISALPVATGTGTGSVIPIVQGGVTKKITTDNIILPAKNYADSLKLVNSIAISNNTASITANTNAIATKANISSLATINGQSLNNGGANLVIEGASTKPLYKELTPVVDTVTWNYDSSSTANLLTTRTLNLKISGTIPIGSAGVIVVKQGTTGGDSLKYLGTYLGIGKRANKTSLVGFIKNATGFVFSVDTLSNYIASAIEAVSSYDASAQTLFTAAGTTGNNYKVAVDSAIRQLKRINLAAGGTAWTKSLMINGRAGGTLSEQSYNWKDPTIYNYTYNGGIVYNANGTKFNGTTQYINTGIVPSTAFTGSTTDIAIVSVIGANPTPTSSFIYGTNDGQNGNINANPDAPGGYSFIQNGSNIITANPLGTVGRYVKTWINPTTNVLFRNGTVLSYNGILSVATYSTVPFFEGATNFGGAFGFSSARIDVTQIINSKLTEGEAAAIDAVWAAYETALSR